MSPWNQSGRKAKGLWGRICQRKVFSSEWKTEWVREDESSESENGELLCVIGESEGDCLWRGSRTSVGSSFHRQGDTEKSD